MTNMFREIEPNFAHHCLLSLYLPVHDIGAYIQVPTSVEAVKVMRSMCSNQVNGHLTQVFDNRVT